jgi:hypothetical protein
MPITSTYRKDNAVYVVQLLYTGGRKHGQKIYARHTMRIDSEGRYQLPTRYQLLDGTTVNL